MALSDTLAKITAWVDQGRALFDEAAALGVVPDSALVKPIVDGVDDLLRLATKFSAGQLTPIQAAVQGADAQAQALLNEKFPPFSGEGGQ